MKLKILSLWQPHATLCVTPSRHNPEVPAKPGETRHWKTEHRGWLGIHSALKKDPQYKYLAGEAPFTDYIPNFDQLPFGYILGMVYIDNCYATDGLAWLSFLEKVSDEDTERMQEIQAFGNFAPNRYVFTITDFVAFKTPIRATGTQGFWYYEMPNNIGAKVKLWSGQDGVILDYDENEYPYEYLIVRETDEKRLRYAKDQFTVVQPAQSDFFVNGK